MGRIGRGLLVRYKGNTTKLVTSELNSLPWDLWRFDCPMSPDYWPSLALAIKESPTTMTKEDIRQKIGTVKEIYEFIGQRLGITELEEWYNADVENSTKLSAGFRKNVNTLGPRSIVLKRIYPSHKWNQSLFAKPNSKSETVKQITLSSNVDHLLETKPHN